MSEMQKIERFTLGRMPTPIGTMLVVFDRQERLRALNFDAFEDRMARALGLAYGRKNIAMVEGPVCQSVMRKLQAYLDGDITAIDDIPVETAGTQFQREVWAALRTIPGGKTETYGGIARTIHRPKAVRAVGAANGANPVAVVVPCHRVIGSNGLLTGYGGGLDRKRWLLKHEGIEINLEDDRSAPLFAMSENG